jgi:hypothetical protein
LYQPSIQLKIVGVVDGQLHGGCAVHQLRPEHLLILLTHRACADCGGRLAWRLTWAV